MADMTFQRVRVSYNHTQYVDEPFVKNGTKVRFVFSRSAASAHISFANLSGINLLIHSVGHVTEGQVFYMDFSTLAATI